ncbi:DUF502 domain-containing protein [Clostridium ganghwense]|uniref:DUF502 domain-containing protein n=1 Tax=Clostridium ganghwense TaxID=312089 RepID=A0ABT4CSP3_9CLOT|nr:DUF502 domain-containing protein [Clostridium ganghwense]MCY6371443.1 DUF502 domain-containing protein [Clostridium ganghwense]
MKKILNVFLAGITAILPIGLTIFILYQLFMIIDSFSAGIVEFFYGKRVVGVGFLTTVVFILLVGFITKYYLGQKLFSFIEKTVSRIPVAQSIYSAVKEVSKMFSSNDGQKFSKVVSIDFPSKGMKSIGFVTNNEIKMSDKEKIAVFIPTTPNPTNGFLIYVDTENVEFLDISVDEAIKAIVSMGAITPNSFKK